MNKEKLLSSYFMSERFFTLIFSIWFLLFPFDAFVLPVSIGFMTVYPQLVLTVLLFCYLLWRSSITRLIFYQKYALFAYLLLMVYGLAYLPFVENFRVGLMDVRSMILQFLYVGIIIFSYSIMGRKLFENLIFKLAILIFIFFSLVAWAEYFTGIHVAGDHTNKLLNYPVGNITYAPVFIYDNPNTFLVYLFGSAFIVFLVKPPFLKSLKWGFGILFTLLFFSLIADSRIGKFLSIGLILYSLLGYLILNKSVIKGFYFRSMAFLISALILVIFTHQMFLGPLWKKNDAYLLKSIVAVQILNNKPVFINSDSLANEFGKDSLLNAYKDYTSKGSKSSNEIRKNLLLNGAILINKYPLTGVGPGQFSHYTDTHKLPYSTGTINTPHEMLTELFTQYGIPVSILVFLSFLIAMRRAWQISSKQRWKFLQWFMLAAFIVLLGSMPSAWFVLNIGWVLTGLLIISVESTATESYEQ